jgi:hypothetical protein
MNEVCIYCQQSTATTRDHVPPKGIFGKPRPSDLIVVPACDACNTSFEKDDDYFLTLSMEWQASQTTGGGKVTQSRLRSMNRGNGAGRGLWWPIFDTMQRVEILTPGGIYVGDTLAINLNVKRITNTINRTIRGLFYEVTKRMLPVGDSVRSVPMEKFTGSRDFVQHLPCLPARTVGGDVFHFRYLLYDDDPLRSFWYLEFYRRWEFVGFTAWPIESIYANTESSRVKPDPGTPQAI